MTHPGQITWKQIRPMTLMACGAREPVTYGDNGLRFKVGGRMRYVEIELDPSDTYTVRLVRVTRKYEKAVVAEMSDVYCDALGEVVYGLVNK